MIQEEGADYGEPLPGPLCGCCKKPVIILKIKGTPYLRHGKKQFPEFEQIVWRCQCLTRRAIAQCFMCGRCADCCRCSVPALEAR